MDRTVRFAPSLSMRLGRYAAILGALPTVIGSMKELRAIAAALDQAEKSRDAEGARMRMSSPHARSAA